MKKLYYSKVDINVEEAIDNLSYEEQQRLFREKLTDILDIGDAIGCYSEDELIKYMRNNYNEEDIFD